ncbi:hypothetical protein HOLleu_26638 [Holothuria leucospilota]|uniref:Uncharacterized protein n=1 Tax=Holothuria leucospilota TaxID=206669 RepID=A0A9Q1BNY7_HOLLE|nr:hypothetical protein HOLleu_26638 [Holothuria leucospilota]
MGQSESSDYYVEWSNDGNPGQLRETQDRLHGIPRFLTSPRYNTQGDCIRWRISGLRPLTFKVYHNGYLILNLTYTKTCSVLKIKCTSGLRSGIYEIQVANVSGTAIRRLEI